MSRTINNQRKAVKQSSHSGDSAAIKREPAVVRLPVLLKRRLKVKLGEEGRNFQDVAEELITRYVDGDVMHSTDPEVQVQAARASMEKNAVSLRELAK